MIKYEKLSQAPDTNLEYGMSILEENNVSLPGVRPKEKVCIYTDEKLTILLRATGFNKAVLILRAENGNTGHTADIYTAEFKYEPGTK